MRRGSSGQIPRDEENKSAARFFYCAKAKSSERHAGVNRSKARFVHGTTLRQIENAEKTGNYHPTVKPAALLRYLLRMVTPPGGIVLDMFAGSGSTGVAAIEEGFDSVLIEKEADFYAICRARTDFAGQRSDVAKNVALTQH